ncbi:hypothetical protein GOP47_0022867 [Adiantum capillus-veneris]|uniref:Uncharacterized protein n=1 Tax=Adiantum capillus-veneris TaxID=13818 RepID=A0A9D4U7A9_ADICA|nr:hypothetical protein GOP47_0022867 [Adiantum capillus-veneris]
MAASAVAPRPCRLSLWLRQPDRFYFGPLQDALLHSCRAVVSLIHAHHVDQVVLVDNVTIVVAMVLQRSTLQQAQTESQRVRLALIDHITSMPSVVLPIRELVSLCRREGVDEWLFCPHAVAFLHCKAEQLRDLHHQIVAHNYEKGLGRECDWVGTRDYSAHLAAVDAIEFFEKFKGGVRAVQDHNRHSVVSMGAMLADAWGTHCGTPPDLSSSMIMVGLPNAVGVLSHGDAIDLRTRLPEEFGIEVSSSIVDDLPPPNAIAVVSFIPYVLRLAVYALQVRLPARTTKKVATGNPAAPELGTLSAPSDPRTSEASNAQLIVPTAAVPSPFIKSAHMALYSALGGRRATLLFIFENFPFSPHMYCTKGI